MSLLIDFTPDEEARLSAAAQRSGLASEELARKLVTDQLPETDPIAEMNRRLREWQAQDNLPTPPPPPIRNGLTPTAALFQQWEEEDAAMTDEECEAEDRLWEEFQKGINETRAALGMRLL